MDRRGRAPGVPVVRLNADDLNKITRQQRRRVTPTQSEFAGQRLPRLGIEPMAFNPGSKSLFIQRIQYAPQVQTGADVSGFGVL